MNRLQRLADRYLLPIIIVFGIIIGGFLVPERPVKAAQNGPLYCDRQATYDSASAQTLRVITGIAANRIYICGYSMSASAAQVLTLKTGTGTNCGTGTASITPGWNLAAGAVNFGAGGPYAGITPVDFLVDLCVTAANAVSTQITIHYTQQ